ncbi:elongation factor 1-alpha, oocyte form-like [Platysternon megacephalum]|uniref:Elongation factor 1-alpha, oocyte form-like n=1 Tax=Platysternon megacephalum TaxID=55544 RepID=A0A4D9ERQ8_9SAUR|nr:elongation factor 1-alpha, oocyte form-like [Platysternon megacephalum]
MVCLVTGSPVASAHSKPMDPDQQEALNDIQNSVYRTALKLRSVQTLCQLGLTDVSLIQHILPSHQCQREKQNSLTTQQLSQLLKELFQNARLDKPGQVDPQAPELTQNLLTAMYDRTGTGFIKARSAAAALIALSGDSLLTKYKVYFIPTQKENGVQVCTNVLNSAISEEKFLSWLRSEPGLLLWLPTCYRLSATEMVMHHVRCSICKNFPITGLRYRCLKCLNFDLCQVCFFTERQSKPHKRSHPVMEYCEKMSAKENAKIFFRTVRNNLLQERCRRKEARRRQTLEMMEGGNFPEHEQAPPSTELSTSTQPAHHYRSSPAYRLAPELSKHLAEKGSAVQQIENDNRAPAQDKTSAQAIASVKAELLKVRESIKALHSEKRYLRKQLNTWKDKVLLLHNSQEDKSCRLEAKLQVLIANHECVQAELQQVRQEIKAMLQPPNHPSFVLCQNMMPKSEDPWEERKLHKGSDSALAKPIPTSYTEWKSLDPSSAAEKRQLLQTQTDPAAMNLRSSGTTLGSIFLQNGNPLMKQHEKSKEKGIPQTDQEGISQPERTRNLPQGIMTTASSPPAAEVPFNEKEVNEEKELQQLVLKLKDALSLQLQPAQQSAIKQELVSTAEHVCRAFSDLINHVTLPAWK